MRNQYFCAVKYIANEYSQFIDTEENQSAEVGSSVNLHHPSPIEMTTINLFHQVPL